MTVAYEHDALKITETKFRWETASRTSVPYYKNAH